MEDQSNKPQGDILHGATAIAQYLQERGIRINTAGVWYAARKRRLPVGYLGREVIASRRRLDDHIDEITAA